MRSPLVARVAVRFHLERHLATATDKTEIDAVNSILGDQNKFDSFVLTTMGEAGISTPSDHAALPAGWLAMLLQFLIANLPALIQFLIGIFNPPAPVPPAA